MVIFDLERTITAMRSQFCARVVCDPSHAPLSNLTLQSRAVKRSKSESTNRNMPGLSQANRHRAGSFAVHAGAQDYDAHGKALTAGVSTVARNDRFTRCSSMSESAKNLHPQLMQRSGWYRAQAGKDPHTPPAMPGRPRDG